jgi:hypothetical protein
MPIRPYYSFKKKLNLGSTTYPKWPFEFTTGKKKDNALQ